MVRSSGARAAAVLSWLAVGLAAVPASAAGAEPAPAPVPLEEAVAGIDRSLKRLIGLLERLQGQRDIELLLRRIEVAERRLAPLENRLRAAESEGDGLESELARLEDMRAELETAEGLAQGSGLEQPDGPTRQMLDQVEREQRRLTAELEAARGKAQWLEGELANRRRAIELLDEALLELLE